MGTGFAPRDTDDIDLPTTLQRVLLCDGTEVYLFADELAQMPGTYTILQNIAVTHAQQLFDRGTTITNLDLDDLFSVGLYYAENNPGDIFSTARKNGDISWMTWQTKGRETQSYTFQYDNLNRLTSANHAYIDNLRNYVFNKHYDVDFSYDANGNITHLSRKRMPTDPNECGVLMDELTYDYVYGEFGNQLLNIEDMAEADKGFKFTNGASDYQYDANGNLTHDFHKGYVAAYNFLNLPEVFDFGGGKTVDLLYDATGMKLRKTITGSDGNTSAYVKDYCQGIEYRDGVLEAIYHEEGRAVSDGSGGFEYQFRLTDHLGNTRVMFADLNSDGEVMEEEIIQENHYYPFGMTMDGNWTPIVGTENKYQYNGKELNDEGDLNWVDYGARWYDPAIGKWNAVDPLAEQMSAWSPYNYAFNNPIKFIDPDGRNPILPMLAGAITGAGLDIAIQVGMNYASGRSLTDIKWKSVRVSFVSGAAGVGLLTKARTVLNGSTLQAVEMGIDATVNMATQYAQDGSIDLRETGLSVVVGQGVRNPVQKKIKGEAEGTAISLANDLNVAEKGLESATRKIRAGLDPAKANKILAPHHEKVAKAKVAISNHNKMSTIDGVVVGGTSSGTTQRGLNTVTPGQGPVYNLNNHPYNDHPDTPEGWVNPFSRTSKDK